MLASLLLHRRASGLVAVVVALLLGVATPAGAQPTLGFTEDFPGVSTSTWGGGSVIENPGTGGLGGAGDGYLDVSQLTLGNLGTVSFGPEYVGDWTAAGIQQVRCWLRDTGGTGNLEIHLSVSGTAITTTWQQNAGLVPPVGSWAEYVVNLNEADFTQIRGSATFAATLAAVDRLHFRHDVAPFLATPDAAVGAFGLDHIQLTDGSTTDVGPLVSRPVLLAPPYPNPARGRVTFEIRQPESKPVTVIILDAAGRRVRSEVLAAASSAPRIWLWDGRDDAGAALPAGVYRVIARGPNGGMSRTVTLLR